MKLSEIILENEQEHYIQNYYLNVIRKIEAVLFNFKVQCDLHGTETAVNMAEQFLKSLDLDDKLLNFILDSSVNPKTLKLKNKFNAKLAELKNKIKYGL